MKHSIRFILSCLFAFTTLLLSTVTVQASDMRLRLAHVFPQNTTVGKAADEFARLINERTDGRISVAVFPAGQLGGDEAIGRDLKRGSLDLAFVNPNSLVGLDPLFDFHILPYIATDYEAADRIFYSPDGVIQRTLNETLERNGMKALGYFENDFRTISNSEREITGLSDLDGLKLRVVPSQSLKMFFEKAGVNVVILPFPELFTALQQGTVDGQENGLILTHLAQFFETQPYVTVTNHSYVMSTITASEKLMNRLSAEDRELFMRTADEVGRRQVEANRAMTESAIASMEDAGVEIKQLSPEALSEFQELGMEVWGELSSVYGSERIEELRNEVESL